MPSEANYIAASDRHHRLEANGAPPEQVAAALADWEHIHQELTIRQLGTPRTRAGQS